MKGAMRPLDWVLVVVALGGVGYGARCTWELWKWARMCNHARIAVAYKRKVQLQAPLTEWLAWCNRLEADEKATGRMVWRQGHASVSILKPVYPAGRTRQAVRAWRRHKHAAPQAQAREINAAG